MDKPQIDLCAVPELSYLRKLTTEKGIWQHTKGSEPDLAMGYSIDDVARALIVVNQANKVFPSLNTDKDDRRTLAQLGDIYLDFIEKNQLPDGGFHNFDSAEGTPIDQRGSEDSFGRTVWALGNTMKSGINDEQRVRADRILDKANTYLITHEFLRTNSFVIMGIVSSEAHERVEERHQALRNLVDAAVAQFKKVSSADWRWFETEMSYSNGAIPLALLKSTKALTRREKDLGEAAKDVAIDSLDFLISVTQHEGRPAPVGNRGWHKRGTAKPPLYDQQPVDAAAMVLACLEAWQVTNDEKYREVALNWLRWYEGNNILDKTLLEPDGAVHDGINEGVLNANCGAESVVTYLLARLRWAELCCAH